MAKCGKKKKLNSRGAYSLITDPNRIKISKQIKEAMEDPSFPANTGLFLTPDYEDMPIYGPVSHAEKVIFRKKGPRGPSGARIVLTKDLIQSKPRQKWHSPYLDSQELHWGVICPPAHGSSGIRSSARQSFSQKLPVYRPQSTQGRQSISLLPVAETNNIAMAPPTGSN